MAQTEEKIFSDSAGPEVIPCYEIEKEIIPSLVSVLLQEGESDIKNPFLFKKLYKFGKGYSELNIANFDSFDDIIKNICRFFL